MVLPFIGQGEDQGRKSGGEGCGGHCTIRAKTRRKDGEFGQNGRGVMRVLIAG